MNDLFNQNAGRRKPRQEEVVVASADTEESWTAPPQGVRGLQLTLQDVAGNWRWSPITGKVAGGGGTPVQATGVLNWDEGLFIGTLFFAADVGSTIMMIDYQSA